MRMAVIVMALLSISGGMPSKARRLGVEITMTEGEHSRDSNSTTTSITLKGRRLHYVKRHAGYRSSHQQSVDKSVEAREEDLERIRHLLAEKDLLRSRSSISPTGEPGRYVEITASIESRRKRSILKFAAMLPNADRDSLYSGLRELVDEFEQIVNP
jgi:hypothetical protein